jgi:hypothetical protein
MLNGYLTYLTGFGSIAFGVIGWLIGALNETQAGGFILGGFTALGLRRAISNK